jgi:hypothetical protein
MCVASGHRPVKIWDVPPDADGDNLPFLICRRCGVIVPQRASQWKPADRLAWDTPRLYWRRYAPLVRGGNNR